MSTAHPDWSRNARAEEMRRPCGCQAYRIDGSAIGSHREECLVSHARRDGDGEAFRWLEDRNFAWLEKNPWR